MTQRNWHLLKNLDYTLMGLLIENYSGSCFLNSIFLTAHWHSSFGTRVASHWHVVVQSEFFFLILQEMYPTNHSQTTLMILLDVE